MPATTANFSVRVPGTTKDKIDALARALDRPRNYLIVEAIERYIEEESWQIAEIQAGIAEDDADLGIPHDEIMRDVYALIQQAEERRSS